MPKHDSEYWDPEGKKHYVYASGTGEELDRKSHELYEGKCGPGETFVRPYRKKNGILVEAYCRRK